MSQSYRAMLSAGDSIKGSQEAVVTALSAISHYLVEVPLGFGIAAPSYPLLIFNVACASQQEFR